MTVNQLLRSISSRELSEWVAYNRIEPIGERRADLRAGSIVQASLLPHLKRGQKKPSLSDCCLSFERKKMSVGEIRDVFKNLCNRMKGGK